MQRPRMASPTASPFGGSLPPEPAAKLERGSVRRHWLTAPVLLRGAQWLGVPRESFAALQVLADEAAQACADEWGSYTDGAWSALSRFGVAAFALRAPRKKRVRRGDSPNAGNGESPRPESPGVGG